MVAELRVSMDGAVATITIENTGRRNSLTAEMWQSLPTVLASLAEDTAVKVVVARGAGGDFSAGVDIRDIEHILHTPGLPDGGLVTAAEEALAAFPKPTIAAIEGFCIGGGWEIAGACDIRIASDDASFAVTPARIGIIYPLSGIERLVSIAGPAVAKFLLFSGDMVSAPDAARLGLVASTVEAASFDSHIAEFAERLASRSQLSIHATKQLVNGITSGDADLHDTLDRWTAELAASDEQAIGAAAFLARQTPQFSWISTN
jgi:enoyl-CoA hydratase/carnithine racemase